VIVICIILNWTFTLLEVTFNLNAVHLDSITEVIYLADLLMNFFIEDPSRVVNWGSTNSQPLQQHAFMYFQSWFWVDALSCVPVTIIQERTHRSEWMKAWNLLKLFKILKLQDSRLSVTFNRIEEGFKKKLSYLLDRFDLFTGDRLGMAHISVNGLWTLFFIIAYLHITACIYGGLGIHLYQWFPTRSSFWHRETLDSTGEYVYNKVDDSKVWFPDPYFEAFQWALSNALGEPGISFEEVNPNSERTAFNVPLLRFSVLMNLVGLYFISYIIATATVLVQTAFRAKTLELEHMIGIKQLLNAQHVPPKMCNEALRFYHEWWKRGHAYHNKVTLEGLPESFMDKVYLSSKNPILVAFPPFEELAFQRADENGRALHAVLALLEVLESHVFMAGSCIFEEGEEGKELFFIAHGEAEVTKRGPGFLTMLREGQIFGELAFSDNQYIRKRTASVHARTFLELEVLRKADFVELQDEFEDELQNVADYINKQAEERMRADRKARRNDSAKWKQVPRTPLMFLRGQQQQQAATPRASSTSTARPEEA
jgi:CRP-like cAMP-binding protein